MKAKFVRRVTGITGVVTLCMLAQLALAAEVPRMTKEELRSNLDDTAFVIVDVRVGKDWEGSEFKIQGTVRENPKAFNSWAEKYAKEKTLVLYCA